MDEVLNKVREFADQAHGEQLRKYCSDRYIVHPVRVMELCRLHTDDVTMLAAALLHDVVEDTPVTPAGIARFLSGLMSPGQTARTVQLVVELTDVYTKEAYPQWNRRKRKQKETERLKQTGADSQTIKYADIIDNCREIVTHDRQFAGVFLYECNNILKQMDKGNPALYREAQKVINAGFEQLKKEASG